MKDKKTGPQKATALKYDGENAPKVVAQGSGEQAKTIIDTAIAHGVHVHNDPVLSEVLSRLELGDEIPHALYLAVAKVIAFAYFLQGKHPEFAKPPQQDDQLALSSKATKQTPTD